MKKYCIITFLFIQIGISSFSQGIFKKAYKEFFEGDLNNSINLFSKSIQIGDHVAKSYMYRGAAKIFLDKIPESKRDLDSSRSIDSTDPYLFYYYARYFLLNNDYSEALQYCNVAIAKDSTNADFYDERAVIKALLKNFEGSITDADLAIKLDSSRQIYFTDRGYSKLELKEYEEAIEDFTISIKIEPNHKAYANKGLALAKLNMHYSAIENYSNALIYLPDDFEILYLRGLSFVAIGMSDKACLDFKRSASFGYNSALTEVKTNHCK